jgi:hypothetical protein
MGTSSLLVALDYLELLAEVKPEKLEPTAVRWHGRLEVEAACYRLGKDTTMLRWDCLWGVENALPGQVTVGMHRVSGRFLPAARMLCSRRRSTPVTRACSAPSLPPEPTSPGTCSAASGPRPPQAAAPLQRPERSRSHPNGKPDSQLPRAVRNDQRRSPGEGTRHQGRHPPQHTISVPTDDVGVVPGTAAVEDAVAGSLEPGCLRASEASRPLSPCRPLPPDS